LKEFGRAKARVQELEEAHALMNSSKSDEVQHLNSKIIERDEQIKQLDLEFNHSKYNLEKSEAKTRIYRSKWNKCKEHWPMKSIN